jgi:CubicO group peptidase (beta-lactamase class C family)
MKPVVTVAAFILLSLVLSQAERGRAQVQSSTVNAVRAGGQLADKSAQVDALFAPLTQGRTPGAAVLVVQDGKVVHKRGYGLSDIAAYTPITPNTAFDLGSISKPFTAMAIMMLAERGELSYGDPLSRFFPEFPPYARKITIWHLLHHTHGFPDYEGLFVKRGGIDKDYPRPSKGKEEGFEPTIRDTLRLLAQQKELHFAPGDKYEYGGSGYVLLALIIEKVSGKPYPRFLRENIFRPLGMNSTLVYDETRPKVKNKAVSYSRVGERYKNIDYTPLNLIYGDGNVNSTVEDLYKWDQALYTERLLRAGTLEQAFTPGKLNDGTDTGYGSGWLVQNSPGLRRVAHGGSWVGFRNLLVRYPDQRFTIIVLSNFAEFDRETLVYKIARIYLADQMVLPSAFKVDPEALRKYVGRYMLCEWVPAGATDCGGWLDPEAYFDVTLEREALWVKPANREKVRLMPESAAKFFVDGVEDAHFTFNKNARGDVISLTRWQFVEQVAQRVP